MVCKKFGIGETGLGIIAGLCDVSSVLKRIFSLTGVYKDNTLMSFKKARSKVMLEGSTYRWVLQHIKSLSLFL